MTEDESHRHVLAALRRLTVAVGVLAVAVAILVAMQVRAYVQTTSSDSQKASPRPLASLATSPAEPSGAKGFADLSPAQKIREASVVLLTECQGAGTGQKSVITEVLKHRPGTELYLSVGDEMPHGRNHCFDSVAFLVGSPAMEREAYSRDDDRVGGLGFISIQQIRDLVAREDTSTTETTPAE
jgi:hypothetical protein